MAGTIAYAARGQHVMVGLSANNSLRVDLQGSWRDEAKLTLPESAAGAAVTHHGGLPVASENRSRATSGTVFEDSERQRVCNT